MGRGAGSGAGEGRVSAGVPVDRGLATGRRPRIPGYEIRYEPVGSRVRVEAAGAVVVDTARALRLHETRHDPVYYVPVAEVRGGTLEPSPTRTHCPFKGNAVHYHLRVGGRLLRDAAWAYPEPLPEAEPVRDYVAFYADRVDRVVEVGSEASLAGPEDPGDRGPFAEWLYGEAAGAASIEELVAGLADRLEVLGVTPLRLNLLVRTLHPEVLGAAHVYDRASGRVERRELRHEVAEEERYLASPFVPIFAGRGGIRRRLEYEIDLEFPILRELAARGATDYAALPLRFSDGGVHALTLATDVPGGFDVGVLGLLHEALPLLARLVEVHALRHRAETLLATYLGPSAGRRVLSGSIRRGDGEVIPAAIWWADLRGSSQMAWKLGRQDHLALLNAFFDRSAGSVLEFGGEVLKFVGDAVLAIFPLRELPDAPARALAAAERCLAAAGELRSVVPGVDLGPEVPVVVALHQGEVTFGNVGTAGRLDFTVIGSAVNEVARLEGLAKTLGEPLLASREIAAQFPDRFRSLGRHALRGAAAPMEVYGLG